MSKSYSTQIKEILKDRHMSIESFAKLIEQKTGMKMSRQNLTQRLKRDNFQEQDMVLFAEVLGYRLEINLISNSQETTNIESDDSEVIISKEPVKKNKIGLFNFVKHLASGNDDSDNDEMPGNDSIVNIDTPKTKDEIENNLVTIPNEKYNKKNEDFDLEEKEELFYAVPQDILDIAEEEEPDMNPATGEEYESNVVRNHPHLVGYIQVYERAKHKWFDMTEWAFMGYQERKKVVLGNNYVEPTYLD